MTIRGNITKTKYNNPEKQSIKLHSRETKHKITLQGNKTPAKTTSYHLCIQNNGSET
jgi:hypothetical protein